MPHYLKPKRPPMLELPLIFLAGLLGSSHCIGMCGPFALTIGGSSADWSENLWRQGCYSVGRIFTYAILGSFAGFGGWRIAQFAPDAIHLPALLAIVAGALLVYQGLAASGVWGAASANPAGTPCLAGTFFASYLTGSGANNAFLAGLFTGLLPCGLVYAFLALAASAGSWWAGAALMAVFGLGTVPIMVLTGCGGMLLGLAARQRLMTFAAWSVVLTGVVSIVRGFGFLPLGGSEPAGCPFCP